jgi:hypothetical protein
MKNEFMQISRFSSSEAQRLSQDGMKKFVNQLDHEN